jgi:hypothetical protein
VLLTTGPNAGRILLAGGYTNSGASAELFNPATNTFFTGAMIVAIGRDGRGHVGDGVPITGGVRRHPNEAEIYDPATNTFSSAGVCVEATTPRRCSTTAAADRRRLR